MRISLTSVCRATGTPDRYWRPYRFHEGQGLISADRRWEISPRSHAGGWWSAFVWDADAQAEAAELGCVVRDGALRIQKDVGNESDLVDLRPAMAKTVEAWQAEKRDYTIRLAAARERHS